MSCCLWDGVRSAVDGFHKHSLGVKVSFSMVGDTFVCKVCQRARDGDDVDVQEGMELGNGMYQGREMKMQTLHAYQECGVLGEKF